MKNKHKHPNALAQARRRLGLSRRRVARLLGLHAGTIEKYEHGKQLPQLIVALGLEALYRMPIAFLYPTLYTDIRRRIREREAGKGLSDRRPFVPGSGGAG